MPSIIISIIFIQINWSFNLFRIPPEDLLSLSCISMTTHSWWSGQFILLHNYTNPPFPMKIDKHIFCGWMTQRENSDGHHHSHLTLQLNIPKYNPVKNLETLPSIFHLNITSFNSSPSQWIGTCCLCIN